MSVSAAGMLSVLVVAHTGFEPVISTLRRWCPWPLDECATARTGVAGDRGFEPRLTDPESVVLPLDESPAVDSFHFTAHIISIGQFHGNAGGAQAESAELIERGPRTSD